jgi:hypothetical protein
MSGFYTHFMSDRAGKTPKSTFYPRTRVYTVCTFTCRILIQVLSENRYPWPDELNGQRSFLKDYFVLTALSVGSRFVAGRWQLLVLLLPLSLSLSHSIFLSLPSCLDTVVSSRLENKVLIVPTIKLDHATALFFKITNRSSTPPLQQQKGVSFLQERGLLSFFIVQSTL